MKLIPSAVNVIINKGVEKKRNKIAYLSTRINFEKLYNTHVKTQNTLYKNLFQENLLT